MVRARDPLPLRTPRAIAAAHNAIACRSGMKYGFSRMTWRCAEGARRVTGRCKPGQARGTRSRPHVRPASEYIRSGITASGGTVTDDVPAMRAQPKRVSDEGRDGECSGGENEHQPLARVQHSCRGMNAKAKASTKAKPLPYWLDRGEELCSGCEHTHSYAVAARCVACDGSFCPMCVVVVAGESYCPTCHDEGRPAKWRRARSGKA